MEILICGSKLLLCFFRLSCLHLALEKKLREDFITTLEYLITHKSWWDTVDTIAGHSVGVMFKRFPKVRAKYLKKWRKSDHF